MIGHHDIYDMYQTSLNTLKKYLKPKSDKIVHNENGSTPVPPETLTSLPVTTTIPFVASPPMTPGASTVTGKWLCIYCQYHSEYMEYLEHIGVDINKRKVLFSDSNTRSYLYPVIVNHSSRQLLEAHLKSAHIEQWGYEEVSTMGENGGQQYTEAERDKIVTYICRILATPEWGWIYAPHGVGQREGITWYKKHQDNNTLQDYFREEAQAPPTTSSHRKRQGILLESSKSVKSNVISIRAQNLAAEQMGRTFSGIDTVVKDRIDRTKPQSRGHILYAERYNLNAYGYQMVNRVRKELGYTTDTPGLVYHSEDKSNASATIRDLVSPDLDIADREVMINNEDETHNHIQTEIVLTQLKSMLPTDGYSSVLMDYVTAAFQKAKDYDEHTQTLIKERDSALQNRNDAWKERSEAWDERDEARTVASNAIETLQQRLQQMADNFGYDSYEKLMTDLTNGQLPTTVIKSEDEALQRQAAVKQGIKDATKQATQTIRNKQFPPINPNKPTIFS